MTWSLTTELQALLQRSQHPSPSKPPYQRLPIIVTLNLPSSPLDLTKVRLQASGDKGTRQTLTPTFFY